MSLSDATPLTTARRAARKRTRQSRGESREILLHHEAPHTDVSLVRVGTGGVDRKTGDPLHTYWETTAKLRGHALVARTFSHESNARIAYLMAQRGVTDFTTTLGEIDLAAGQGGQGGQVAGLGPDPLCAGRWALWGVVGSAQSPSTRRVYSPPLTPQ